MNLLSRIAKLEKMANTGGNYCLYDALGTEVEAHIIRKPTPETNGLARLSDGNEIPIVYDAVAIHLEVKVAGEPEDEKPALDEDKLYYRMRPGAEVDTRNMRVKLPDGLTLEDI